MDYRERITIEPDKLGGKPCIRGLRITVYDVLDYLASGMSQEEILRDFPDLTPEDIRACLAFAAERERRLMALRPREAPTNPATDIVLYRTVEAHLETFLPHTAGDAKRSGRPVFVKREFEAYLSCGILGRKGRKPPT
jgi:uncharacterized protein (DUF433 family)